MVQDYLASGRKGGQMGQTAGLPYRFCFFLHQQDALLNEQEQEADAAESSHGAPLVLMHCLGSMHAMIGDSGYSVLIGSFQ